MTNDKAREAAVEVYTPAETCHLLSRNLVRTGWDACIAHLRATGQLCTVEERAILESVALECEPRTMTNYDRSEAFRRIYGVARRAKGGSDVG